MNLIQPADWLQTEERLNKMLGHKFWRHYLSWNTHSIKRSINNCACCQYWQTLTDITKPETKTGPTPEINCWMLPFVVALPKVNLFGNGVAPFKSESFLDHHSYLQHQAAGDLLSLDPEFHNAVMAILCNCTRQNLDYGLDIALDIPYLGCSRLPGMESVRVINLLGPHIYAWLRASTHLKGHLMIPDIIYAFSG